MSIAKCYKVRNNNVIRTSVLIMNLLQLHMQNILIIFSEYL